MAGKRGSQWAANKGIAEAILRDRRQRRSTLGWFAFAMLGMFALGLWGIDGWLQGSAWRFGLYWAMCGLWCLFVMLFAALDALMAVKEEREKSGR